MDIQTFEYMTLNFLSCLANVCQAGVFSFGFHPAGALPKSFFA